MADEKIFKKIKGVTHRLDSVEEKLNRNIVKVNDNFMDVTKDIDRIDKDMDTIFGADKIRYKNLKTMQKQIDKHGFRIGLLCIGGIILAASCLSYRRRIRDLEERLDEMEKDDWTEAQPVAFMEEEKEE